MSLDLGLAARTLALDLATGEVVQALETATIDCMVLKGPAMVHRLYENAPGTRNYSDIDLAVAPADFDAAGRVLSTLGFDDHRDGIRASEAARLQERPWHRDRGAYVRVDLHRGFHNVADWTAWWDLLIVHRDVLVVEGQEVVIPDAVGCALIAGLHASKAGASGKPHEDLRRALRRFDDDVWRHAGALADSVGAGRAFVAALCGQDAGAEVAARLGWGVTDPVVWFRATAVARGSASLGLLLEPGPLPVRARRLRDVAWPSRVILTGRWPHAAQGPGGLVAARIGRLGVIAVRLPQLLLTWHRVSRTRPDRRALPPHARPLRARLGSALRTSWWTLRAWRQIHRRLAGDRWDTIAPRPADTGGSQSRRAVRLTLRGCRATCLESALVRQAVAAGAGRAIDVVVGVTAPAGGFRAHAWLDGDRVAPELVELWRYPAGRGRRSVT